MRFYFKTSLMKMYAAVAFFARRIAYFMFALSAYFYNFAYSRTASSIIVVAGFS
jgi:hypothetical protein